MDRSQLILLAMLLCATTQPVVAAPPPDSPVARQEAEHLNQLPPIRPQAGQIDRSGRKETGKASYYSKEFVNRKMANGHKLNPNDDTAASKSLPLGSVATVKNLDNGKSTTVRVEDRGPYVPGRIIDLTPKAAGQINLQHKGVAPVEVKPITVPTPDGVKLGAGAAEADPHQVEQAVRTTQELTSDPGPGR
jgi:rare lipoprotein A